MTMLSVKPPAWMRQSVCTTNDLSLFFPEKGQSVEPAKAICATCPVAAECLDWVLSLEAEDGSMPGVYGGTSVTERKVMLKGLKCAARFCGRNAALGTDRCDHHREQVAA